MLIEIVSHCWTGKFSHYAASLCYQVSSLVLNPSKHTRVILTVCYCPSDEKTVKVLKWADSVLGRDLSIVPMDDRHLGRRAIGRNWAAKTSPADIVWFSDVDQVFRDGILDRLVQMEWLDDTVMIYPKEIMIHRNHATGDIATSLMGDEPRLLSIFPDEFIPKKYNRAIGGVQIVKGDFAREYGYLDGDEKWMKPTDGRFVSCRCDRAYRSVSKERGKMKGVNLPGVYRIRHTQASHGREPRL